MSGRDHAIRRTRPDVVRVDSSPAGRKLGAAKGVWHLLSVLCHCSLPAERVLRPGAHVAVADTRSAPAAAVAAVGFAPFVVKHSKRPPHEAKRCDDQGCEVFTVCRETLPGK